MTDLSTRVLQGASRELDAEIALTLGIVKERDGNCFYGHRNHSVMVLERDFYAHEGNSPELPHFTGSLDAAMTLVPEEHRQNWLAGWALDGSGTATVGQDRPVYAATPALALCAAALKARGL